MLQQQFLAQPDMVGCDLDQFVVVNKFQRLFQAHADGRAEHNVFISTGGTDVGQLLAL